MLQDTIPTKDFLRFLSLAAGTASPEFEDASTYRGLFAEIAELTSSGPSARHVLSALPRMIGQRFERRGWAWNGYYVAREDASALDLGHAFGPPVCTPLDRNGGILASGMCWDAILANQALLAEDVGQWPGYVSCDNKSGLTTAAGLVCPIRDATGRPVGVWDLDAHGALTASDLRAMGALFSTLSRTWPIRAADLLP
ncbi:MAG: hypothetical protein H6832_15695 [Planctomycetes bacterium]|nr:hypothetical protein [Planctomycetota bacterium]MCB9919845.1 hypothetical protein [Planctomycetota bacterium]